MRKTDTAQRANMSLRLLSLLIIILLVSACASTEEGAEARKGAKWGAAGGATVGLILGAATGDAKFALAGAATGAAVGGASGAMYEYGQHRDDKRNKTLADAIAGSKSASDNSAPTIANPLESFIGEWKVNAWGMMPDGSKITATGKGKGILSERNQARIDYFDIKSEGYEKSLNGYAIINFDEKNGLTMSTYGNDNEIDARFVGEYIAEQNKFSFYLTDSQSKSTITGVLKSDIRMEVRIAGVNLWMVETYTLLDGKDTQIQSYRFSKN